MKIVSLASIERVPLSSTSPSSGPVLPDVGAITYAVNSQMSSFDLESRSRAISAALEGQRDASTVSSAIYAVNGQMSQYAPDLRTNVIEAALRGPYELGQLSTFIYGVNSQMSQYTLQQRAQVMTRGLDRKVDPRYPLPLPIPTA